MGHKVDILFYINSIPVTPPTVVKPRVCAKGDAICIPSNYSKFDLPNEDLTTVNVGIDIKDIPKIDDKEFSITLNAFFVVRWTDARMIIDQVILHFLRNFIKLGLANPWKFLSFKDP